MVDVNATASILLPEARSSRGTYLVAKAGHIAHRSITVALVVEVHVRGTEALERVLGCHERGALAGAVIVAQLAGKIGTEQESKGKTWVCELQVKQRERIATFWLCM